MKQRAHSLPDVLDTDNQDDDSEVIVQPTLTEVIILNLITHPQPYFLASN